MHAFAILAAASCVGLPQLQVLHKQVERRPDVRHDPRRDIVHVLRGAFHGSLRGLDCRQRVLEHLVLEDRIVQREAQAHRMRRLQRDHDIHACRVRVLGGQARLRPDVLVADLGHVAVVVALHLEVEGLRLGAALAGQEDRVDELQDGVAYLYHLELELAAVAEAASSLPFLFLLLLGGAHGDAADGAAAPAEGVFEGGREHVALLRVERRALPDSLLHIGHHVVIALSDFGDMCQENGLVLPAHRHAKAPSPRR
mmetsp:Transcript_14485/g.41312  ORF Transcript_14485/g.41312 Transcript_14485/m.41312 type:complete len:255 (+) Transcript_14485:37-801(+)